MFGTGCAVQEIKTQEGAGQAGCEEGARSGGTRVMRTLCCYAALPWIRSLATISRDGGKLKCARHTARHKVRCAVGEGREPRGDGTRMRGEDDRWTVRTRSPVALHLRRGSSVR